MTIRSLFVKTGKVICYTAPNVVFVFVHDVLFFWQSSITIVLTTLHAVYKYQF